VRGQQRRELAEHGELRGGRDSARPDGGTELLDDIPALAGRVRAVIVADGGIESGGELAEARAGGGVEAALLLGLIGASKIPIHG
jgi:hypothetical protein